MKVYAEKTKKRKPLFLSLKICEIIITDEDTSTEFRMHKVHKSGSRELILGGLGPANFVTNVTVHIFIKIRSHLGANAKCT